MDLEPPPPPPAAANLGLQAYLLGSVTFDAALTLQRRLAYQVAGDRSAGALVLCEHPPLITVGRHGSRGHIHIEPEELRVRGCPVRWVNRGGGCLLHLPGQLAAYPMLPLDRLGLGVQDYLDRLHDVLRAVLDDFSVQGETRPGRAGVWVAGRPIALVGVAVRDWVSYYGAYLNLAPDLDALRRVRFDGTEVMTSLARERRGPVRPALVRQRFVEHFAARFGLARLALFTDHPALGRRASSDAVATGS